MRLNFGAIVAVISCVILIACGGGGGSSASPSGGGSGGGGGGGSNQHVTVYHLISNTESMDMLVRDIESLPDGRPNFDRIVISFAQPNMHTYTHGDLSGTGLLGFFNSTDINGLLGDPQSVPTNDNINNYDGVATFGKLKDFIKKLQSHNIMVLLSVGGWNYSCKPDDYCKYSIADSVKSHYPDVNCQASDTDSDNAIPFGDFCFGGPKAYQLANPYNLGWFPDPTQDSASYQNVVDLAVDLDVDGIDIDYEEFGYADATANVWKAGGPSTVTISNPSYSDMVSDQFVAASGGQISGHGSFSKQSVVKFTNVINILHDNISKSNKPSMILTTAAPIVGAIPIMSSNYGGATSLSNLDSYGEPWFDGNLKGLMYNTLFYNKDALNHFSNIGIMSYDVGAASPNDCEMAAQDFGDRTCSINNQVAFYVHEYRHWLYASNPSDFVVISGTNLQPAKFNSLKSLLQFGVEVNCPAYPASDKLCINHANLSKLIASVGPMTDGAIVWQLYSAPITDNTACGCKADSLGDGTTAKDVINSLCTAFKLDASKYNCNANFPSVSSMGVNRRH